MKFITISLLALVVFFNTTLSAQTLGEYRSKQSGNWNDSNTWEQWDGSAWVTQHQSSATPVTPVVEGTATGVQTTDVSSHPINLPSDIVAGEILLVVFSVDNNPTVTVNTIESGNNWFKLGQSSRGSDVTGAIFWKIAEGGDSLTLTTSVIQSSSHISYRISGAVSVSGTVDDDSSANTDPPLHTPNGGAWDYLWIATRSADNTYVATAAPTDYSDLLTIGAGVSSGASTNTAVRTLNASSQDPGTFTSVSEQWVSYTISVRGDSDPAYSPISFPQSSFPTVAGTASSAETSSTSSHDVALPSGIVAGDMLLIFWADRNSASTVNIPSGWTTLYDVVQTGEYRRLVMYKKADGTEGTNLIITTTGTTERSAHNAYRIAAGTYYGVPTAGSLVLGTDASPNAPSLTPGGGSKNFLWIAASHSDGNTTGTAPAGYTDLVTGFTGSTGTSHARMMTARKEQSAASEDPGTFSLGSNRNWGANTIAIQGAGPVVVKNSHIVTVTANVEVEETTVEAGAEMVVNNGITFTVPSGGVFDNVAGSIISGAGRLDFSGNTFTNVGTIEPGFSPGKLYIDDNFVNNGILNIEITGAPAGGAGVAFDQLEVDGSAAINGTINIDFGVYVPTAGSKYQIVLSNTATYSGTPTLNVLSNVVPVTYSNGVLTTYAASYEKVWDGEANTNAWEDGNNWYPNGVPTAGQDVLIALDANVVLSSNPTIKSLIIGFSETADTLTIAENYTLTTTGNGPIGNDAIHLYEDSENVLIVEGSLMISDCTGDGIDVNPMTSLTIASTGSVTVSDPGNDGIEIGSDFSNSGIVIITSPGQHGLNVQGSASSATLENNSTGSITALEAGIYGIALGSGTTFINDGTITLTTDATDIFSGSGDLMNNGTFKGIGNIDGNDFFSGSGSTIAPGTSPGILTFTNSSSMDFSNNVIFDFEINGKTTPGVDYDQIAVAGPSVNITNGTLNLSGTYTPAPGDIFTLFNVSGGNVIGTFNGLPEGSEITFNTKTLTISYVGGNIRLSAQAPLPVELISFNAQAMENEVKLSWATANEINNDFFTLERSLDGRTFEAIATIFGNGTTSEISNYNHMDKNPVRGLNYYRLKQTDYDGQFSYSDIKTAELKNNGTIKVYPTVVNGVVTVETENDFKGNVTILVRDLTGRDYKSIPMTSRSNKMELSLNDLIPGIYFVVITTDTTSFTQKIIKQ